MCILLTLRKTGMPRILLSTAHLTPLILNSLKLSYTPPKQPLPFPPLPLPFHATAERIERLQKTSPSLDDKTEVYRESCGKSAGKEFCNDERVRGLLALCEEL